MLSYILKQVGFKIGLDPSVPSQRAVLLRFVNEVAYDLWTTSDMAGVLEEQYFKINGNQTVSLPDYVGDIRAMRQADSRIAIQLSQLRPRYNEYNWTQEWRNWRIKGAFALQDSLKNQGLLTVTVPTIENPPVVVNITGSTSNSGLINETLTLNSTSVTTINSYTDVKSFTKTTINQYNVILSDMDGNQLSYIANNKLEAKFQVLDISGAPWFINNLSPLLGWVEVLFKRALPWFQNDSDEFPAYGYDNVIVAKVLEMYYEEQGNIQAAVAFEQKATELLAKIHENANRGTDDTVAFVRNPHFDMQHRVGFGRDWRYAWRINGR